MRVDESQKMGTRLTCAGVVILVAWRERAGQESVLRIGSESLDLLCKLEHDGLVSRGSPVRSRILVLGDGGDLWVDRFELGADHRLHSDAGRVSLERRVRESGDLAGDVVGGLRVQEGLIGCSLMQAIRASGELRGQRGTREQDETSALDEPNPLLWVPCSPFRSR